MHRIYHIRVDISDSAQISNEELTCTWQHYIALICVTKNRTGDGEVRAWARRVGQGFSGTEASLCLQSDHTMKACGFFFTKIHPYR